MLNGLADHGKAVRITRHGEPIAVLMDHAAFEALLDDIDDVDDYRALAEHDADSDADEETIAWELAARDLGAARPTTPFVDPRRRQGARGNPKRDRARIEAAVALLARTPRPPKARRLVGAGDRWRVRVGTTGSSTNIHQGELVILVIRIAHRREVYR